MFTKKNPGVMLTDEELTEACRFRDDTTISYSSTEKFNFRTFLFVNSVNKFL